MPLALIAALWCAASFHKSARGRAPGARGACPAAGIVADATHVGAEADRRRRLHPALAAPRADSRAGSAHDSRPCGRRSRRTSRSRRRRCLTTARRVKVGDNELAWHAVDTLNYNVNLYHFAYALNKPTTNVLFWAVTVVNSPREMTGVRLAIGSNAASVWWVNGKEATALYNDRQAVIDDGVSKRLTLHKGANMIRAAIVNAGGATDFCARFLDENDRPIKGLTATWPRSDRRRLTECRVRQGV